MANHAKCCVPVDDVLIEGGRAGVLLIPRLGGSPADFAALTAALAENGYTVSSPVLFGHCGSRQLLAATTWQQWYGSVMDAHDELGKRCDAVMVCGLGVGALLALRLAAERPEDVHGVVLLAPTFWPNGWATPWHARVLHLMENKRFANMFRLDDRFPFGIKDAEVRREAMAQVGDDGRPAADVNGRLGGVFLEVKWLAKIVLSQLVRVRQPTLIFHPRHDDRSSLAASQKLQKQLGGIVDLVVLEDSYHLVVRDKQHPIVVNRVLEFGAALRRLMKQRQDKPVPTLNPTPTQ